MKQYTWILLIGLVVSLSQVGSCTKEAKTSLKMGSIIGSSDASQYEPDALIVAKFVDRVPIVVVRMRDFSYHVTPVTQRLYNHLHVLDTMKVDTAMMGYEFSPKRKVK